MVKDGYKQTDIGVFPDDWDVKIIGSFTDATAGGTPSTAEPSYWSGDIPWMSSGELNNRRVYNVKGRITEAGLQNSSTNWVPSDCVLIGLAGQGKTRGTVAINYIPLCTNQSIAAIFPSDSHSTEYLYQNLQSRYDELRSLSSGDGGRGGLNLKLIKALEIPFPPLEEQKAIAEALSDIDALIDSLEKLIEKKKAIKQGAMQELLTGKRRLDGFSEDWQYYKLSQLCKLINGRAYAQEELLADGKYPVLRLGNLFTNEHWYYSDLELPEKQYCVDGDLIYAWSATFGPRIWHGEKCIYHYHIWKLELSSIVNKDFFYHYLSFDVGTLMSELNGGTMSHLTKANMEKRICYIPPYTEQIAIAEILTDLDIDIETNIERLKKYRLIKAGMMAELLTGRIRLI